MPVFVKTTSLLSSIKMCGKSSCSLKKSNGTILFTAIFSKKKEYFWFYQNERNITVSFVTSYNFLNFVLILNKRLGKVLSIQFFTFFSFVFLFNHDCAQSKCVRFVVRVTCEH